MKDVFEWLAVAGKENARREKVDASGNVGWGY